MQERDGVEPAGIPEAEAPFVLIVQGAAPWAGVVEGIEGVRDALSRILRGDPERAVLGEVAAILAALGSPATWRAHGEGDGRPFWHLWFGVEGGSVTVQRLTAPLPAAADLGRVRVALGEIAALLAEQAAEMGASGAGRGAGPTYGRWRPERSDG